MAFTEWWVKRKTMWILIELVANSESFFLLKPAVSGLKCHTLFLPLISLYPTRGTSGNSGFKGKMSHKSIVGFCWSSREDHCTLEVFRKAIKITMAVYHVELVPYTVVWNVPNYEYTFFFLDLGNDQVWHCLTSTKYKNSLQAAQSAPIRAELLHIC